MHAATTTLLSIMNAPATAPISYVRTVCANPPRCTVMRLAQQKSYSKLVPEVHHNKHEIIPCACLLPQGASALGCSYPHARHAHCHSGIPVISKIIPRGGCTRASQAEAKHLLSHPGRIRPPDRGEAEAISHQYRSGVSTQPSTPIICVSSRSRRVPAALPLGRCIRETGKYNQQKFPLHFRRTARTGMFLALLPEYVRLPLSRGRLPMSYYYVLYPPVLHYCLRCLVRCQCSQWAYRSCSSCFSRRHPPLLVLRPPASKSEVPLIISWPCASTPLYSSGV